MSRFLRHDFCPDCGSENNLAVYDDHEYCFTPSCGRLVYYDNYKETKTITTETKPICGLPTSTQPALKHRRLDASTVQKYKVTVFDDPDSDVEAIFPRFDNDGNHVANQIRLKEKQFKFQGQASKAGLFGQPCFPAGGRSITITEGYYDTMAAFRLTGSRYPNVGVMSASTAKKEVVNAFEYLNSFEQIIINFDNDEVGQQAAKECAILFDPGKVRMLCLRKHKDANDYLMKGDDREYINEWHRAPVFMPDGLLLGTEMWEEIENHKPFCP